MLSLSLKTDIAHGLALVGHVRLQKVRNKVGKKKNEIARLLAVEKAIQENSAVVEGLKKDVLTFTMKVCEQIGIPTVSLKQAKKRSVG